MYECVFEWVNVAQRFELLLDWKSYKNADHLYNKQARALQPADDLSIVVLKSNAQVGIWYNKISHVGRGEAVYSFVCHQPHLEVWS